MLRTCPTCRAYYADELLAFCLADGSPLSEVDSGSKEWQEGSRSIQEKATRLQRLKRLRILRRILVSGVVTAMSVLLFTQSYTVETTRPAVVAGESIPVPSPSPSVEISPPPIVVYGISGRLMFNDRPLAGVKVRLEGSKVSDTITDENGIYSFIDLPAGGSFTITPVGEMNFTPANHTFDNLGRDELFDFVGTISAPPR